MVVAASTASSVRSGSSPTQKNSTRAFRKNNTSPDPSRPPLISSERDNATLTRRPPRKEISSRYLSSCTISPSPTTSTSSSNTSVSSPYSASPRRSPSPIPSYLPSTPLVIPRSVPPRRSHSVERTRPTTPRIDSRSGRGVVYPEVTNAAKALCTTTRNLSVSFQGESYFYQTNKVNNSPTPPPPRKPTPDLRRPTTPARHISTGMGEKPTDHHECWPSARSIQSSLLPRSPHSLLDKDHIVSTVQLPQQSMSFDDGRRRTPFDGSDPFTDMHNISSGSHPGTSAQVSSRDLGMPVRLGQESDSRLQTLPQHGRFISSILKNSASPKVPSVRRSSVESPVRSPWPPSPLCGLARHCNPSKRSGSPSKAIASPSLVRSSKLFSSSIRGQTQNVPSITGYRPELRRSSKGESQIEAAIMLKLSYNQHLQWRVVNASINAALLVQSVFSEKKLYNAWLTNSEKYCLVTSQKIKLHLLTQHLKQEIILKGQRIYVEDWFNLEKEYSSSLSRTVEALKACTLHLPVVDRARADLQEVKHAVGAAVDVMQAMGASLDSLLRKAEGAGSFISELAGIFLQGQALLHQARDLLTTVAALHVKQCSLMGQLLQLKRRPRQMQP